MKWNPLVFAILCGLSIFNVYAFVVLIVRARRRLRLELSVNEKKFVRAVAILLLLSNWIYLLSRPRGLF